ncbi:hypothetical protein QUF63_00005 [Anaerolineales bacterium HSG25]|nr:hypothetical protein [Anaerolineales bacterium HSG25]
MNNWFSKNLGDGMMAYEPIAQIEKIFLPLFADAGKPLDMAVFTRHNLEGRLHCEVMAYFSPATTEVARILEAKPCQRPSPEGLDLLVGDKDCWSVLFSENKG